MTAKVNIKGIREGLLVSVDEGSWHEARAALLEKMAERASFIQGAKVTIDVGMHQLHAAEMGKLRDQLSEMGISLFAVLSKSPVTEASAQALGLGTRIFKPAERTIPSSQKPVQPGEEGLFVQRTLRSGVRIEYPGNVTIIGDVNPGSEVVAGGSILVWGTLRGTVHAGAEGDPKAIICALALTPTQLRIAGQIAIPPEQVGESKPEVARLVDGKVVAEPWK